MLHVLHIAEIHPKDPGMLLAEKGTIGQSFREPEK